MRSRLRVLCTSTGGVGHVHALSPVARALRERGHDVQWAVAPDGGVAVGAMDFEWAPSGLTTAARREAGTGELPAILQLPMAQRRGPLFANFFARVAAPAVRRDLAPILDRVRPDIVVREAGELAAAPMAASRGIPDSLGAVPDNVRVERFVPQAELLGRASAVVSHGGAGTVLGAASHGRPQLVVPMFADQWENGVAVESAGCGVALGPDRRDADELARSLRAVLDDPAISAAAGRVAAEIASMPPAADLAAEIEALATV